MKKTIIPLFSKTLFVFALFIATLAQAQTPQYYNYNTNGDGENSYPLNQPGGQTVQLLYRHGDFNNPTSVTPGYITSISIRISDTYGLGPWVYNGFTIKAGLTTDTDLPTTNFFTGTLSPVSILSFT